MAFPDLPRPSMLRFLLGPRLPQNQNGFRGAHIVGDNFWATVVSWLNDLGFDGNADSNSNVVLLPESERGGAVLGVATHLGNHFKEFDQLFYFGLTDPDDPDELAKFRSSNPYLNTLERDRNADSEAAQEIYGDDEGGLKTEEDRINREYKIQVLLRKFYYGDTCNNPFTLWWTTLA